MENVVKEITGDSVIITMEFFKKVDKEVGDFLFAMGIVNNLAYNLRSLIGKDIITKRERLYPKPRLAK